MYLKKKILKTVFIFTLITVLVLFFMPSVVFALPKTYTITATAGENGSITPSGDVIVKNGHNQTFTIASIGGPFQIEDVLIDGISVGAVSSYQFTNVTSNHTISATFVFVIPNGEITITKKITEAQKADLTFYFNIAGTDFHTDPLPPVNINTSVTIPKGQTEASKTITVDIGFDYVVTEINIPAGWELQSSSGTEFRFTIDQYSANPIFTNTQPWADI